MTASPGRFALPAALAALVLLGLLLVLGLRPPAARSAAAPADEFSAGRALAVLQRLLAEGVPHPTGSDAHAVVRDRIIAELETLGYDVAVQSATSCRGNRCFPLENLMTRLPGRDADATAGAADAREPGAVMLASHYDSHPRAPGAGDAGAGVAAILEIARILRAEAPFRNDIILLLTDAEEPGLLGAQAFVREHPWADDVAIVINLEARGTSGPSIMFETSADNRGLVREFARAVRRPVASSLTYDVYRLMPVDTDATVFRRAGMAVLNFAFIGDVANYHTERDDLAHLDARSVQHHGDNALAAVRRFADLPLPDGLSVGAGDAAYADLFGRVVVRWPAAWQLPLAVLFSLLILAAALRLVARGEMRGTALAWGLLATALGLGAAVIFGLGVGRLLGSTGTRGSIVHRWDGPATIALWIGAPALVLASARVVARRAHFHGLFFGAWLGIAMMTIALAATLPGAAVVLVIPLCFGALASLAVGRRWVPAEVPPIVAALGAGLTLIPLAVLLKSAFVLHLPFAITAVVAIVGLPLMALVPVREQPMRNRP